MLLPEMFFTIGNASQMTSETAVSQHTQLALTDHGGLAMRNNVGVAVDMTGRHIRYGLMNESKAVNTKFKSSDLIDCLPIVIQPHHVGRTFGLFVALETKRSDWRLLPSDAHGHAQQAFMQLIRQRGGMSDFITDAQQFKQLLELYK